MKTEQILELINELTYQLVEFTLAGLSEWREELMHGGDAPQFLEVLNSLEHNRKHITKLLSSTLSGISEEDLRNDKVQGYLHDIMDRMKLWNQAIEELRDLRLGLIYERSSLFPTKAGTIVGDLKGMKIYKA